ncbi:MAG: dimethylmenaquinone methyltransferase [Bryobacterales bacterium]|jgi:regulator of RNase E activity RraA|nr:dimethylmenaquinone methyltransferase [Bryobacterales bacterium]
MIRKINTASGRWISALAAVAVVMALAAPASAQMFAFSKEDLVEFTAQNPFDRFPDGRPRIPDNLIERARGLSMEEILMIGQKGFRNQYVDGWKILQPGKKMVGRAFTVLFMPSRPDVDQVVAARGKAKGLQPYNNQTVIDMLGPNDVVVVDLFGKQEGGTFVGDNLFYYIMRTTHNAGMVIDGSVRDLEGIANMPMPGYVRDFHPSAIGNVVLAGWNIPVRIGGATVMPGDLVVGDREGIYFIPPALVTEVLDRADETHVHDEWTRKKFDEGKYKSTDIYGSPRAPELKKEYQEYLERRMKEIRGK